MEIEMEKQECESKSRAEQRREWKKSYTAT